MRRALIVGVAGQDGAYLARLLRARNYTVWGTSRDLGKADFANLDRLGIREEVTTRTMDAADAASVAAVLEAAAPDEVYDLRGPSCVETAPAAREAVTAIYLGTQTLLETIRRSHQRARFFSAGSAASFGDLGEPASEATPLRPISPFGIAKAAAAGQVARYRDAFGVFAVTGILFDHVSRLQAASAVSATIIRTAQAIAAGRAGRLELSDDQIVRDWGWTPEYVDAMWRMLQPYTPRDYVIASGESMSLRDFVAHVFENFGLAPDQHLLPAGSQRGTADAKTPRADPARARDELGWRAYTKGRELVDVLCDSYRADPLP